MVKQSRKKSRRQKRKSFRKKQVKLVESMEKWLAVTLHKKRINNY